MLRHRCAVNNAGSSVRGKKFSEIFRKKGLAFKPRHLVVVEGIFLFLVLALAYSSLALFLCCYRPGTTLRVIMLLRHS